MKIISFDCYGTLIDWEIGILSTLRPLFNKYEIDIEDDEILEIYSIIESRLERNYLPYKEILKRIVLKFSDYFDFDLEKEEKLILLNNFGNFEPFEDTNDVLKTIKDKGYKIAIISNVDDDLFELTKRKFDVEFDYVITASQVKAYKPSHLIFEYALKVFNVEKNALLHVAQSYYHDIIPTKELGIRNVHIKRRGFGATPRVYKITADFEFDNLRDLLNII